MKAEFAARRGAQLVLLAASLAALGGAAIAQENGAIPEVRIQASGVAKKRIGTSTIGAPIEIAEITLRISYADLPLETNSAQALLRDRVASAAKEACMELSRLYAPGSPGTSHRECVRKAVSEATPQVDAAIAAAKSREAGAR